jgi:hypothetical protein
MSRRNWLWYVLSSSVLVLTAALGYAGWRQMELGTAQTGLHLPAYGRNLALSAMLSPCGTVRLPADRRGAAVPAMLSAAGLEVIAWMVYRP